MIEGDEQSVRTSSGLNVPVSGRIGVIVYVTIGQAAPDLQLAGASVAQVDGKRVPVLSVHNTGNAHGRLGGFLSGVDAKGRTLEFTPSTLPILPKETRSIALGATDGANEIADIAYPVRIKGVLEWGDGKRIEFDQLFAQ
jgi:uncharacterized protein RhaS with RHS repeats